jgi:hypothetical protein
VKAQVSPQQAAAKLADAIKGQAVKAGTETAQIRRADWRQATVNTVNSDGTVLTSDGITARCLDSYSTPIVSDTIVLTQSGNGNWVALGRICTTTPTWQTPTLGSGWAAGTSTYQALRYRKDDLGDTLIITGAVHSTSSTPAGVLFTLPAGYRPAVDQRPPCMANAGAVYSGHSLMINHSTGTVTPDPAFSASSADLYVNVFVPLGNIS